MTQLQTTTAAAEQAWNAQQLHQRVCVPQFAIWTYRTPGVVLGISQRPSDAMRRAAEVAALALVQRQSGGGAVLVGPHQLSVSVVLPPDHPLVNPNLVRTYERFGELHAHALRRLGINCRALDRSARAAMSAHRLRSGLQWACFGTLSAWEVVTSHGGKKLVGLAQRRCRNGTLLVSGTLLSEPDWNLLCRVCDRPPREAEMISELTSSCSRECRRSVSAHSVARVLQDELTRALRE